MIVQVILENVFHNSGIEGDSDKENSALYYVYVVDGEIRDIDLSKSTRSDLTQAEKDLALKAARTPMCIHPGMVWRDSVEFECSTTTLVSRREVK